MSLNRILLCEKNKYFKDVLLQIIHNRFPDVDVKWVLSSHECLSETKRFKPDILIFGVNVFSGNKELETLQRLRMNHPAVNIVIFSDYCIEEYRKEAILRGATHFISKESWTGQEILALINNIFSSNKDIAGQTE